MKRFLLIICLSLINLYTYAQESYQINDEDLELYTEAKGDVTLLWNTIDGDYRYFVVKEGETFELTNDRGTRGRRYQEEYKQTLNQVTPETEIPVEKVKLTLGSLRDFINAHNAAMDSDYVAKNKSVNAKARFGIFGGMTNAVYSPNPNNETTAVAGIELELYSDKKFNRHSIFTQVRHIFEKDNYEYNYTGLSINYRFKVINSKWFHFYVEAEAVEFYYTEEPAYIYDADSGDIASVERKEDFSLDLPLSLGAGMAIRLGKDTFLTLSYNDFVALTKDDNGEFPIDFTAGLKFNL